MRYIFLFLLVALFLSGCDSSSAPSDSGIFGQVLLGPTCPVEMPGMECADKPYQATLTVVAPSGRRVTRFTTDRDGTFRINLAPGDYILHPETPQAQILPVAADQTFTVEAGQFTQLVVSYDTGIR